jgi:hypothetical protein
MKIFSMLFVFILMIEIKNNFSELFQWSYIHTNLN